MENLQKIVVLGIFLTLLAVIFFAPSPASMPSPDSILEPISTSTPASAPNSTSTLVEDIDIVTDDKIPPVKTDTFGVVCTDKQKRAEMCTMEYAPVCGFLEVQCVNTPCDPIPKTFGNACSACAQGSVVSYTRGECKL
ncbi:MAG: hypothetical protein ACI92I_000110 [Acidimicrobiales bacterium]|jgi:hypothetical protein